MSYSNGPIYPQANQAPLPTGDYPGKNMGLVAMILSLINFIGIPTALIGLIMGYMAQRQSKEAGVENIFAKVAIIVGWIIVGLTVLLFGGIIALGLISSAVSSGY